MKIRKLFKVAIYQWASVLLRIPFVNSVRLNGNKLVNLKKIVWNSQIDIHGTNNRIILKKGGVLNGCKIIIHGNDNLIEIGESTSLISGELIIEDDKNKIIIGNDTQICGKTLLACMEGTQIVIGNHCLFSSQIMLRTGDSHSILNMEGKRINFSKDIIVEDHVWIGVGVSLMKGAMISGDSVVGAKSVVTHSFNKRNVAIAGNPAKIIKENVNWDINRI